MAVFKLLCHYKNFDEAFKFFVSQNEKAKIHLARCRLAKNRTSLHLFKDPEHNAEFLKYTSINSLGDTLLSTPLMLAVRRWNLPLIEFLVDNGADVNIPDRSGNRVITRLIQMKWVEGFKAAIRKNPIITREDCYYMSDHIDLEMMKITVHHLDKIGSLRKDLVEPMLWKAVSNDDVDLVESMISPLEGVYVPDVGHPLAIKSPRMAMLLARKGILSSTITGSSLIHALRTGHIQSVKIFLALGCHFGFLPEIAYSSSGCEMFELILSVSSVQIDFNVVDCVHKISPTYLRCQPWFLETLDEMRYVITALQYDQSSIPCLFDMVWYTLRAISFRKEIASLRDSMQKL